MLCSEVFFLAWLEWLQCVANVESGDDAAMGRTKANATNEMKCARSNRCTSDSALGNARWCSR
jgi:hypothetical protein